MGTLRPALFFIAAGAAGLAFKVEEPQN